MRRLSEDDCWLLGVSFLVAVSVPLAVGMWVMFRVVGWSM